MGGTTVNPSLLSQAKAKLAEVQAHITDYDIPSVESKPFTASDGSKHLLIFGKNKNGNGYHLVDEQLTPLEVPYTELLKSPQK